jgi:hypothetical protein
VRFVLIGLLLGVLIFLVSEGHFLFLPLFFVLPLGLLGRRRRRDS